MMTSLMKSVGFFFSAHCTLLPYIDINRIRMPLYWLNMTVCQIVRKYHAPKTILNFHKVAKVWSLYRIIKYLYISTRYLLYNYTFVIEQILYTNHSFETGVLKTMKNKKYAYTKLSHLSYNIFFHSRLNFFQFSSP